MDGIIVEKIPVNRFLRRKTGFWFGMWVWNSVADKHGVKFEEFDKIPAGVLAVDAMYYGMEWYAWKKKKRAISYQLMTKSLELMPAAQIKRLQDALMNSRIGGKTIMEMKESKKKTSSEELKDFALGELGLSADEFYSMTWGNFQRASLGYVKRSWVINREIVAAIYSTVSKKRVKGDDVFSFGITEIPDTPTEADREYMRKRHENRIRHERNKQN